MHTYYLELALRTRRLYDYPGREDAAFHQEILRELHSEHVPAGFQAVRGDVLPTVRPTIADEYYRRRGQLSPPAYGYLALIVQLLRLPYTDIATHLKLWGYVGTYATPIEKFREFIEIAIQGGLLDPGTQAEAQSEYLKVCAEDMLGHVILHYTDDQLRGLLRWLHESYEPYLDNLLRHSSTDGQWLQHLSFLIGRLLMRNIVPLFEEQATGEGPSLVLGADFGYTDPATVSFGSSLYRSVFSAEAIQTLAQQAQRMDELFAHAYSTLLRALEPLSEVENLDGEDRDECWARVRSKISNVQMVFTSKLIKMHATGEKVRARMILEDEYRRYLAMPTYVYEVTRRTMPDPISNLPEYLSTWEVPATRADHNKTWRSRLSNLFRRPEK